MSTLAVLMELNFRHLMVVYIYVLDLMTILFVYGMLKHQNHYIFSMDIKMMLIVLIFHHYKATAIIAMTIIILANINIIRIYVIVQVRVQFVFFKQKIFLCKKNYAYTRIEPAPEPYFNCNVLLFVVFDVLFSFIVLLSEENIFKKKLKLAKESNIAASFVERGK
ncbi:hypothetical protein RFI_30680 [Reticulomyxa filosa]|uniref:Uncharacterized protein n=1 Tax=Reticulomyxa filosa TaxID=46433 RepID=X6LXP1_RETFI|nr:hypothetical protein RFI_30680 [Reticulomyxa filosa]|eukprot:ETO06713.1 hypothetical protein RFI_30680 [Reticulomyxa filosa]